jgi:cytochrome c553
MRTCCGIRWAAIGRCACALTATLSVVATVHAAPREISFTSDVKPLLARRCFSCHGPDVGEGGLRLHEQETALAELDSGLHAIVPGDMELSELIARVSAEDESLRMPPEGKPLTAEEIETLKAWIAQGAPWQKHWAFVPPQKHAPPAVKNKEWVRNPIDAFVLAKLEEAGL